MALAPGKARLNESNSIIYTVAHPVLHSALLSPKHNALDCDATVSLFHFPIQVINIVYDYLSKLHLEKGLSKFIYGYRLLSIEVLFLVLVVGFWVYVRV